ncbi:hypothetical protein NSK_002770 [Nannochloropsis salina CCMP1776]|uniref:U6 snRNA-associated Sm-like protein LSm8 n=1 Tax=Nannochloropsis salina CCMP1776 TaxID=1027361 RepID=A0A4D9D3D3_9STRA|nr:hypothetical protein NSK_002770 [Nannochloropsis salina CCMP1776]|eukprot:TFJ85950.1 hypothetical protein NSK_002770 [Nannochloropsis salina CCMP1776]
MVHRETEARGPAQPHAIMAATLEKLKDRVICVITNDGRNIVGVLKGFDQTTNIILQECHERVFSTTAGVEQVPLGLYIVRGDNIAVVGEMDEEADAALDLSSLKGDHLKPVIH